MMLKFIDLFKEAILKAKENLNAGIPFISILVPFLSLYALIDKALASMVNRKGKSQFQKLVFIWMILFAFFQSGSAQVCDCKDVIYLNEPTTGGAVHKFRVDPVTGELDELGSPWYDNAASGESITAPHGVAADLNGNVYIGEQAANGGIRKLNSNGDILPSSEFYATGTRGQFNIGVIDNLIYSNNNRTNGNRITAFDVCTGEQVSWVVLDGISSVGNNRDWGFYIDPFTSSMYSSSTWTAGGSFNGFFVFDESDFGTPGNTISRITPNPPLPSDVAIRGITTDNLGNIYVVIKGTSSCSTCSYLIKYDSSFNQIATSSVDLMDGDGGWHNAAGIVYSPESGRLYVSTESKLDDCVYMFDTDLTDIMSVYPAPLSGGDNGKGIAIIQECCPIAPAEPLELSICGNRIGEEISLLELYGCSAAMPEGTWTPIMGNTGIDFDDCDNTLMITSLPACGGFTFSSDGSGPFDQCGAFDITINIEAVDPEISTILVTEPACSGFLPPLVEASTTTSSDPLDVAITYQWQESTDLMVWTDVGTDMASYQPGIAGNDSLYVRLITETDAIQCPVPGFCADTSLAVLIVDGGCEFDLALEVVDPVGTFVYGDPVTFPIEVTNQGDYTSEETEATISIPDGYIFDAMDPLNAGWVDNMDGTVTYTFTDPIDQGMMDMVDLVLEVQEVAMPDGDSWTIDGAITNFTPEVPGLMDVDSDPTLIETPLDYAGNGDITDDMGGDDEDPGFIEIFDLALDMTTMDMTTMYGDMVTFDLVLENEGNVGSDDPVITVPLPEGFAFDPVVNPDWTLNPDGTLTYTPVTPIGLLNPSEFVTFELVLEAIQSDGGADDWDVYAEITEYNPATPGLLDVDSTEGNESSLEDDDAILSFEIFDLALTKTIDPTSVPASGMYAAGDEITFFVNVINQGSVDAENVLITDLIPCGMEVFDNMNAVNVSSNWTASMVNANASSGYMTQTTLASLPAGTTVQVPIVMTLVSPLGGHTDGLLTYNLCPPAMDSYLNQSYIESAEDDGMPAVDIDSNPGALTPEEEAVIPNGPGDNDEESTGLGTAGDGSGSEDDSDPANIGLFDLALSKVLTSADEPYQYGETATFEICVTNQGNIPTDSIQIVDYIPAGYTFAPSNSAQWTDNMDGTATYNSTAADFAGFDNAGEMGFLEQLCVTIDLIVQAAPGGLVDYTNTAEVSGATTLVDDGMGTIIMDFVAADNDGAFDTDPTNDAGGALGTDSDAMTSMNNDPAIQGDGTGAPGDEDATTDSDDSDIAGIEIVDFALTKVIDSPEAPYSYGDTVTFKIKVYNQGTVAGQNISILDFAPIGLEYIDDPIINPGWSGTASAHSFMLSGPIAPAACDSVNVKMIITDLGTSAADYTNIAEITSVFDDGGLNITNDDVDSTPGGGPFDDAGGAADTDSDNSIDGDGSGAPGDTDSSTDEDDSDPAFVKIFDLAQTKEIIGDGYVVGDTVPYLITTYNQGNSPVTNIAVNDYLPTGLIFLATENPDWALNGTTAQTTIMDTLQAGTSAMDTLYLEVQASIGADAYTNISEISSFEDTLSNSSLTDPSIGDADSTPNDDPTDDSGGSPGTGSDDVVDGDGSGAPGDEDPLTDEDDADPAFLSIPDLALLKTTAEAGPFSYGDTVTFDIFIVNQGNVPSTNVEITDYIPSGFMYLPSNDPLWGESGSNAVTTITDTLVSGGSVVVSIDLLILNASADPTDAYTNEAEISKAFEEDGVTPFEDVDSTPNDDNTDDAGGDPLSDADDTITGDGTGAPDDGNGDTDEDDHDPELIRIMDVAQAKMIIGSGPYVYGDTIPFIIETYNQGNVDLVDVEISDYIPVGFTFDGTINSGWTGVDGPGDQTAIYTIPDTIVGGTSVLDTIYLVLTMTDGGLDNYTNVSEVSYAADTLGNDTAGAGPDGGLVDADSDINNDTTDNGGGEPGTDSDDVVDGDGTGAPGDEDATTDEDNSDPAIVEIVDLALIKNTTDVGPFEYGDTVTYQITVFNQGNVDANNIIVTDYIPSGFDYSTSSADTWSGGTEGPIDVTYTIADTLLAGDSTTLEIDLIIKADNDGDADRYTNVAEISSTTDLEGTDITGDDIDSEANAINGDDAGGNPETGSDDVADGDGTGMPGDEDPETDEDDADPEFIQVFDLALTKVTMMTTGNSFGDTIEFMITVYNQGNMPVTDVEVTDFMPDGFGYVSDNDLAGWSYDPVAMTADTIIGDTILPGETVTLSYFVEIMMSALGDAFENQAEISEFADTLGNNSTDNPDIVLDADSTPDDMNGNDAGGEPGTDSDNAVDGDGSGLPGGEIAETDEDDSDPALIQVIDVAIQKTIVDGQAPYKYGEPVDFLVKVINQGNEPLYNVEVTDYIPAGFVYDPVSDANGWTYDGTNAIDTIAGPMNQWDSVELIITLIPIQLIPSDDPDAWTNVAEVSQMFDEEDNDISLDDIDSQADSDPTNDPGGEPVTGSDDSLDGDGNNGGGMPGDIDPASDEDDSDPALLPIMDLALTKQLVFPDSIYVFGDEMEFFITLHNQGNIPATNVEVTEYIPGALTEVGATNDPAWMFAGTTATYLYEDTLQVGASDTILLNMVFQIGSTVEDYVNYAEISEIADTMGNNTTDNPDVLADADSTPNGNNTDDAGGEPDSEADNFIDGDGSGTIGDGVAATDEDDHDPVQIGFVDMALVKTLADPTTPVQVGNDVTFDIVVINQGTFPMVDIEVIDYIPEGFALSAANGMAWAPDVDGNARTTLAGPLGFEESDTLQILLTVLPNANADNLVNVAELSEFFFNFGDEATDLDIDSQADTIPDNDPGGMIYTDSDDAVDGDGTGIPGDADPLTDEDDADPSVPQVLDLALIKTIDPLTPAVRPGDPVTFEVEICNQGNIPTGSVTIEDRIPEGLELSPTDANGWVVIDDKTIQYTFDSDLLQDSCISVAVDMIVLAGYAADDMINVAEIITVIDTNNIDVSDLDIDSSPNDDDGEAEGSFGTADDDSTAGSAENGEDSDDADPAAPPIMDLAIQKINPTSGSNTRGDVVPFEVTVFNQGNMVAQSIEVSDYIPAGLVATASNTGWNIAGSLATYTISELLPGADTTLIINLEILTTATPMNVVNMAEVSGAFDTLGIAYSGGGNDFDSDYDDDNTNDVGNEIYDLENDNVLDEFGIGHDLDGIDDEDDHDQAWALLCDAVLCIRDINISLDETCMAELVPTMLLSGPIFPNNVYDIEIVGPDGVVKSDNFFNSDDVGKTFEVSIINPLCGQNSCWANVNIENKFAPTIECNSDTISCGELIVLAPPTVVNNCGEIDLRLIDRQTVDVACEDPELQTVITETWVATDPDGFRSDTCTQTLSVEKFNIADVEGPVTTDTTLNCANGIMPSAAELGVPTLNGVDLYPDNFADCGIFVSFEDEFFNFGNDCTSGVQRTWTVQNWICGTDNTTTFAQLVTFVDTTGPVLSGVPADMTVSTSGFDCEASVTLPAIGTDDACNPDDIRVDINYEGGFQMNTNGATIQLAAGTSTVTYIAYDLCGNASSASFNVTIQDLAQPVTICDAFTTVSLNTEGLASLSASKLDNGSLDECGPVILEIARMDDDLGFMEEVDFSCADIGSENIMVALRVTDISGNSNICMAQVELQDKIPPVLISGLPDITVSCEYEFSMEDLSVFGTVVNSADSVNPIVIDDETVQFSGAAQDALVLDNCSTAVMSEITDSDLDNCGNGTLTRTITLTSPNGETTSLTQEITIVNNTPFVEADITWPADVTITSNDTTANPFNLPAGSNFPQFANSGCDDVSSTFEDDVDEFYSDECTTVITRTWFVSDWCQRVNNVFVIFEYTQMITIIKEDTPVITTVCEDVTVAADPDDCSGAFVSLLVEADVECSDGGLDYTYVLDYDNDGSDDVSEVGSDASGFYPPGTHKVTFTVQNGGAIAECSYLFTVTIIDPTIVVTSACEDIVVDADDCDGANVALVVAAEAGCATDDLTYSYVIDLNNDGSEDLSGTGADASGDYVPGTHSITFTIDNGISTDECTYLFTVNMPDVDINITSACEDVTVNANSDDCSGADVALEVAAEAGCATDDLTYSYVIDLNNDGTDDVTGMTADASGTYVPGTHSITFTVDNGMDTEECSYLFTVTTTDTTTAICETTQTVVLELTDSDGDMINDTEKIIIAPSLIDDGSNNSCALDITLSFSADVDDQMRMYGCDDVGQQALMLWVTDENGVQASCITSIVVSDDNGEDLCTPVADGICECDDPNDFTGMIVVTCNVDFTTGGNRLDPVGAIYDVRNNSMAVPGTDWGQTAPVAPQIPTPNWTYDEIGPIFGIAVDRSANVYLGQTDVYNITDVPTGSIDVSYEAGWIYRAPAPTFTAAEFVQLPNTGGPLNGIGNLAFDHENDQLFATNLEDGMIYRISSAGVILETYDPFTADDGIDGIADQDEQIWGIGVNTENGVTKIYFPRITASSREIYSLELLGGAFPAAGSEQLEISNIPGYLPRITDIAFSQDGTKMLISERGLHRTDVLDGTVGNDIENPGVLLTGHLARVLNYELDGSAWEEITKDNGDQKYFLGGNVRDDGNNSAGGVTFGYLDDGSDSPKCDTLIWASGNALNSTIFDNSERTYGIQAINYNGNLSATAATGGNRETDLYIDFDGELGPADEKGVIGDVEIFGCGSATNALLVDINGTLNTEEAVEISAADVFLEGTDIKDVSNEEGSYSFDEMPMGGDYTVRPILDTDHRNGVTTLDLILIQKHILGISVLASPYKMIAADVDNNGSISATDLFELRKVILGLNQTFTKNTSWKFIDAAHEFVDSKDPWAQEIPEQYDIYNLNSNMNVDFIGLKVGDVNGSAELNGLPINAESRSVEQPFVLSYDDKMLKAGAQVTIPFYGDRIDDLLGYQFTMEFDTRRVEVEQVLSMSEGFSGLNFGESYLDEGYLTSSWDNISDLEMTADKALFGLKLIVKEDIRLSEVFKLTSEITSKEAYTISGELLEVELGLRNGTEDIVGSPALYQNQPNPWIKNTVISFRLPEATKASLRIFDVTGKLVKVHTSDYEAGLHEYELQEQDFSSRGVYYYELISEDYKMTKKMVLIK